MANPLFIPIRFAMNGAKNVIQKVMQVGQDQEDATWDLGWPAITMIPKEDGGLAPKGQDFNGVLYTLSDHAVHRQNGEQILFSQDVVDNYGGYSLGSIIQSNDSLRHYRSLINNNTFDPNTTPIAGRWEIYAGSGSLPIASSTIAGVMKVINSLTSTDSGSALSAAQGEVLNSAIGTKANFSDFGKSQSQNGYQKFPNGLILQWGFNSESSVTFPTEFNSTCFGVIGSYANQTYDTRIFAVISLNRLGFQTNTQTRQYYWIAIGY